MSELNLTTEEKVITKDATSPISSMAISPRRTKSKSNLNSYNDLSTIQKDKNYSPMSWVLILIPICTLVYNAYHDYHPHQSWIVTCNSNLLNPYTGNYTYDKFGSNLPTCIINNNFNPSSCASFSPGSQGLVLIMDVACIVLVIDLLMRLEMRTRAPLKLLEYGVIVQNSAKYKTRMVAQIFIIIIVLIIYTVFKEYIIDSGVVYVTPNLYVTSVNPQDKFEIILVGIISVGVYGGVLTVYYTKLKDIYNNITLKDLAFHNLISDIKFIKVLKMDIMDDVLNEYTRGNNCLYKGFWYLPCTNLGKINLLDDDLDVVKNNIILKLLEKCSDINEKLEDEFVKVCGKSVL
jgi:hypothetical protein